MLRLVLITLCTLTWTDNIVQAYTMTRSRDYPTSYSSSSGFVGLPKDTSDLADTLSMKGGYAAASSHRYSTVSGGGGHASPVSGYPSSAYPEAAASSVYSTHTSTNADGLNSIGGSYTNDGGHTSDGNSYSSGSSNAEAYSSTGNNHGPATFTSYTGSPSAGLSINDHSTEYSSPSSSSSSSSLSSSAAYGASSLSNYAAPKTAAYSSSASGHIHAPSSYSSAPTMSFLTSSHPTYSGSHSSPSSSPSASSSYHGSHLSSYPSRPVSSYPGAHSFADGPRFQQTLSNYLSPHSSAVPSSGFHSSQGPSSSHRGSIPSFLLGAASNPSPNFAKTTGPYYSSGAYPKSGNKFIIIKDAGGHTALMHAGESSFPNRMFAAGSSSGYKVRSAGPFSAGPHMAASSFVSSGYPGSGGHHGGGPGSSYYYQ